MSMTITTTLARTLLASLFCLLLVFASAGCDSSGDSAQATGTVTIGLEEGVDLTTGRVQRPGNFQNSDLIATAAGSHVRLATGGDNPVDSRPVNWFVTASGLFEKFASLAEVPGEKPADGQTAPQIRTETGNGFVVQTMRGTWSRGWISSASSRSVTIEFEPLHTD